MIWFLCRTGVLAFVGLHWPLWPWTNFLIKFKHNWPVCNNQMSKPISELDRVFQFTARTLSVIMIPPLSFIYDLDFDCSGVGPDYGRPLKPFFIEIGIGQTNWADKFWGIWGIFGRTISTHFGTVSPLSMFSIIQPFFSKKS